MDTETPKDLSTSGELRGQWQAPGDVFVLLLLIGGDIVQKALAQQVGIYLQPFKNCSFKLGVTPIAFSFGWVAYAFMSLMSAAGDHQLMPPCSEYNSLVINCDNAFTRSNLSWMLNRLLRDHETEHEVDPRRTSLRIDIFQQGLIGKADVDAAWILGWLVILIQIVISFIPWIVYGDWGIFMITLCGTFLALLTGSLPQWSTEKWAGRPLSKPKVTCLTRGNGSFHVMVFIGGSGCWDVEALAGGNSKPHKETTWILVVLAVLWILLLISAAGLKEHTWFLVGVGGLGMLQNVYAAGCPKKPGASNFHLTNHQREAIIAERARQDDNKNDAENSDDDLGSSHDLLQPKNNDEIHNVMDALMEVERIVPKTGLALLKVFFPGGIRYKKERIRYMSQRKFWKSRFRAQGFDVPTPRRISPVKSHGAKEADSGQEKEDGGKE
jgi:hypothetical protein